MLGRAGVSRPRAYDGPWHNDHDSQASDPAARSESRLISRVTSHRHSTSGVLALSAVLGLGAFIGFAILGDRTQVNLLIALIASLGAAGTAALTVRSPASASGTAIE